MEVYRNKSPKGGTQIRTEDKGFAGPGLRPLGYTTVELSWYYTTEQIF